MTVHYPENETKITHSAIIGLIKMTTNTVQIFSTTTIHTPKMLFVPEGILNNDILR